MVNSENIHTSNMIVTDQMVVLYLYLGNKKGGYEFVKDQGELYGRIGRK